jgi:hypothetical protein
MEGSMMNRTMASYLGVAALTLAAGVATVGPSVAARASAESCAVTWGSQPKKAELVGSGGSVTQIRAGRNECYDRLVLDGGSFGWVEYVDEVRADGSGEVVPVRGGAKLRVITNTADGTQVGPELVNVSGWTTFRQVVSAGDFEGWLTMGLGVRARLPFRVFMLQAGSGPSRVVIDVAHHW